jgi:serine/threonine protein kinase
MVDDDRTAVEQRAPGGGLAGAVKQPDRSLGDDGEDELLPPGIRAGDYEIVEPIASGGCGSVYKARHTGNGRLAAVKVLRSDLARSPDMVVRFMREAQAVNQIRHPNIVEIDECGLLGNQQPYLLMEFLEGHDVSQHLKMVGRMSPPRVLEIVEPVCKALDAAHKAGFVHRDVKASNVFLAQQDGREVVKLLDFGIAKLMNPEPGAMNLTKTRHVLGSAQTMAPEQILAGAVGPATDVYGVGGLLFLLLVGRYPFSSVVGTDLERKILGAAAPRPSEIVPMSPALDEVIGRCLAKRPDARYATCAQLLEDLRAAVSSSPNTAVASATASSIYVDIRIADAHADEDDAFDAVANALERAESVLIDAGFSVVVSTGSSLLTVQLHPGEGDDHGIRERAARVAADLHAELIGASDAAPLEIAISLNAGPVRVSNQRAVGGPLLEVSTWAPWSGPGAFATADSLRDVAEPRLTNRL